MIAILVLVPIATRFVVIISIISIGIIISGKVG